MVRYYYYYEDGVLRRGPFSLSELIELAKSRRIAPATVIESDSGQRIKAGQMKELFPHAVERSKKTVSTLDNDLGNVLKQTQVKYCERCRAILRKGETFCYECGYENKKAEPDIELHDPADAARIKNAYRLYIIFYIIASVVTAAGIICFSLCAFRAMNAVSWEQQFGDSQVGETFSFLNDEEIWDESQTDILLDVLRNFSPLNLFLGVIMIFIGLFLGAVSLVFMMILHYKMWQQIPKKNANTSPGWAVALLFVPFFSIIWRFVSFYGLAKSINKSLATTDSRRRVRPGLALTVCILRCFGFVPGVSFVLAFFVPIMFYDLKTGASALALSDES